MATRLSTAAAAVTWDNLVTHFKGEDVEEFLNKANIADVIFSMNDAVLKETIFICMKKFERFPNIHLRSIQLLQDIQVLSSRGISSEELNNRFDHLIQPLSLYMDKVDIVVNLFELLAMVADRKSMKNKCAKTEGDNCLLGYISQALSIHVNERAVQRAGLQLYEAILNNANDKSQKKMARDIFKAVVNNLASTTSEDPSICYSSYSILCTLAEKMGDKLSTWMDRILGMLLTTISQLFSAELVAKCIQLLEKIALSVESLYVISAHPRCLLVFTDALGVLEPKHLGVCITILEFLVKLLEDETSLIIASENIIEQGEDEVQYFVEFRTLFRSRTERYLLMLGDHRNIDINSAAIDYYQQLVDESINLLNAILGGSDDPPVGKTRSMQKQPPALIESIIDPTDSLETIVEEDGSNDDDDEEEDKQERLKKVSNLVLAQDQSVAKHGDGQAVGWSNLDQAANEEVSVELFLRHADVVEAVFMLDDSEGIKKALFGCLRRYSTNGTIVNRVLQFLQDCHLLTPSGLTNRELELYFDTLLSVLSTWMAREGSGDIVANLFALITMVADRKCIKEQCTKVEPGQGQLLNYVNIAFETNVRNKSVQRAGMQLYEAILKHADVTDRQQSSFSEIMFKDVLNNLITTSDDPSICYSSISILCILADDIGDDLSTSLVNPIMGILLTTISQLFSAELVSKCIQLLKKIALTEESLILIASHPRCILVFTDALSILQPNHVLQCITVMEYLIRFLENDTVIEVLFENLKEQQLDDQEFFESYLVSFRSKSRRYMRDLREASSSSSSSVAERESAEHLRKCIVFSKALLKELLGNDDDNDSESEIDEIKEVKSDKVYHDTKDDVVVLKDSAIEESSLTSESGDISATSRHEVESLLSSAVMAVPDEKDVYRVATVGSDEGVVKEYEDDDNMVVVMENEELTHLGVGEELRLAEEHRSLESQVVEIVKAKELIEQERIVEREKLQLEARLSQDNEYRVLLQERASQLEEERNSLEFQATEARAIAESMAKEMELAEKERIAEREKLQLEVQLSQEKEQKRLAEIEAKLAEDRRVFECEIIAAQQSTAKMAQEKELADRERKLALEQVELEIEDAREKARKELLSLKTQTDNEIAFVKQKAETEIMENERHRLIEIEKAEKEIRIQKQLIAEREAELDEERNNLEQQISQARANASMIAKSYELAEQQRISEKEKLQSELLTSQEREEKRLAAKEAKLEEERKALELQIIAAQETADQIAKAKEIAEYEQKIAMEQVEMEIQAARDKANHELLSLKAQTEKEINAVREKANHEREMAEKLRFAAIEKAQVEISMAKQLAEQDRIAAKAQVEFEIRAAQEKAERDLLALKAQTDLEIAWAREKADQDRIAAQAKAEADIVAVRQKAEDEVMLLKQRAAAIVDEQAVAHAMIDKDLQEARSRAELEIKELKERVENERLLAESIRADELAAAELRAKTELNKLILEAEQLEEALLHNDDNNNTTATAEEQQLTRNLYLAERIARVKSDEVAAREAFELELRSRRARDAEEDSRIMAEEEAVRRTFEIEELENKRLFEEEQEVLLAELAKLRENAELESRLIILRANEEAARIIEEQERIAKEISLEAEKEGLRISIEKEARINKERDDHYASLKVISELEAAKIALEAAEEKTRVQKCEADAIKASVELEKETARILANEEKLLAETVLTTIREKARIEMERMITQQEFFRLEDERLSAQKEMMQKESERIEKERQILRLETDKLLHDKRALERSAAKDKAAVMAAEREATKERREVEKRLAKEKSQQIEEERSKLRVEAHRLAAKEVALQREKIESERALMKAKMEHASAMSAAAKDRADRLVAEEKLAKHAAKIEADEKAAAVAAMRIEEMQLAAKEKASLIAAQKAAARETERAANAEKTARLASLAQAKISELLAQKEALERESANMETQLVDMVTQLVDIDHAPHLSADSSDAHCSTEILTVQQLQRGVPLPSSSSRMTSPLLHHQQHHHHQQQGESIAIEPMMESINRARDPSQSITAIDIAGRLYRDAMNQVETILQPISQSSQQQLTSPLKDLDLTADLRSPSPTPPPPPFEKPLLDALAGRSNPRSTSTNGPLSPIAQHTTTTPTTSFQSSKSSSSSSKNKRTNMVYNNSNHHHSGSGDGGHSSSLDITLGEVKSSKLDAVTSGISEAFTQIILSEDRRDTHGSSSSFKRELTISLDTVLSSLKSDSVQLFAIKLITLFRKLKEQRENMSHRSDGVVSMKLMKHCVKRLGLVDGRYLQLLDVDMTLSLLGVKQLSLYGFTFTIMLCAEKSIGNCTIYRNKDTDKHVNGFLLLIEMLGCMVDQSILELRREEEDEQQSWKHAILFKDTQPYCSSIEREGVKKLVEREKKALYQLYEAYLPSNLVAYVDASSALKSHQHHSNGTGSSTTTLLGNIATTSSSSSLIGGGGVGGLTFSCLVTFFHDFQLSPSLFNRLQMLKVFHSLFRNNNINDARAIGGDSNTRQHKQSSLEQFFDSSKIIVSSHLITLSESLSHTEGDKGERDYELTLIDIEHKLFLTFPQFLDFLILSAITCPMFKSTEPPFLKVSNFLLLLSQGSKNDRLFRTKEVLSFRVNPMMMALATATASPLSSDSLSIHSSTPINSRIRQSLREDCRTHSSSYSYNKNKNTPTSSHAAATTTPTMLLSPSTSGPYYDPFTGSIAFGQIKKSMQQLKSKLGRDSF